MQYTSWLFCTVQEDVNMSNDLKGLSREILKKSLWKKKTPNLVVLELMS